MRIICIQIGSTALQRGSVADINSLPSNCACVDYFATDEGLPVNNIGTDAALFAQSRVKLRLARSPSFTDSTSCLPSSPQMSKDEHLVYQQRSSVASSTVTSPRNFNFEQSLTPNEGWSDGAAFTHSTIGEENSVDYAPERKLSKNVGRLQALTLDPVLQTVSQSSSTTSAARLTQSNPSESRSNVVNGKNVPTVKRRLSRSSSFSKNILMTQERGQSLKDIAAEMRNTESSSVKKTTRAKTGNANSTYRFDSPHRNQVGRPLYWPPEMAAEESNISSATATVSQIFQAHRTKQENQSCFELPVEVQVIKGVLGFPFKIKVIRGRAIVSEINQQMLADTEVIR